MPRLILAVAWLALLAGNAQGAGFALIEQNASGMGNAYAGQAAVAEDASTIFFNPAGMTRLAGKQLVAAAHGILPSAKFGDTGSNTAPTQTELGANGGDAGTPAWVPNVYFAMPLGKEWAFGLGISAPFGLASEYDRTWVGRFHAVKSDLETVNINPSLAFKAHDAWSVGFGVNAQQARAELSKMANYGALVADAEGLVTVQGDAWGWGYNLGVLFEPRPDIRVGFSYRSKVDYELEGTATYADHPALGTFSLPVTAKTSMPASASLSLYKVLSPTWDFLADATWTQWSVFDRLTVRRTNGTLLDDTIEDWHDAWRLSVGVTRHVGQQLTWRFGVAYDESPVPDARRTPRIPDADRLWLAVGFQYRMDKQRVWDLGYTHIFVKDAQVNIPGVLANGTNSLVGNYRNKIDILSVQYTHNF